MHMAQLMPLSLTVSCSSKIQIGFTFLVLAQPGSPGKRAIKRVCVCMHLVLRYLKRTGNATLLIIIQEAQTYTSVLQSVNMYVILH